MFHIPNTALSIEMGDDTIFIYWGGNGEICNEFFKKDGYWYDADDRLGKSIVDVIDRILDLVSEITDCGEYYESEAFIRRNLLEH